MKVSVSVVVGYVEPNATFGEVNFLIYGSASSSGTNQEKKGREGREEGGRGRREEGGGRREEGGGRREEGGGRREEGEDEG